MSNKKKYLIFGLVLIVVAAAAFVGGRLLNGSAGNAGILPFPGDGGSVSMAFSIKSIPAPELPTTEPVAVGTFVKRQDNVISIQAFNMMSGAAAVSGSVVISGGSGETGPTISGGPGGGDPNAGPAVEVVITKDTKLYRDATEMPIPSAGKTDVTVQQKMEPGTLDDLKSMTMVMVWGRKSGDRIIADVVSYSNPIMIQNPR